MKNNKINITTIGGGTGTFNVLNGLKNNENYNLAAVISMFDSGGSTGVLMDEFGVLPPGDIRRGVLALSEETTLLRKLFEYRFTKDSSVNGHTIGNLLLTAMSDITGSFEQGLGEVCKMFRVKGKVVPVSLEKSDLCVKLENGEEIVGEKNIDSPLHDPNLLIEKAYLSPKVKINPRARSVLENSDIIIIGPGDLYTSIIPNLLVSGVSEAIHRSNAKVVYFCNIMTKYGETNNFEVIDFVDVIKKYLKKGELDYLVVNSGHISDYMIRKYKKQDNKKPVKIKNIDDFKRKKYKVIERDMLNDKDFVRHSSEKLASVIDDIVNGWIK
ncbi:hypothetical protein CSB07_01520 [Candidatus Gracilibacteria bacterium]|nr:MAG: hypothetical protein CSB07_01520 [Candidatus Gracilibacteria bacterium]PIE85041.1 MAG: hypothetical protein CSA08_03820 [Candidatus Gracilibacteria bacterium]